MDLSTKTIETLIDLVEIKLSCFEIYDRDDRKVQRDLQDCLSELTRVSGRERAVPEQTAPEPTAQAA